MSLGFNLGSYNLTCKKTKILYLSDYVFVAPTDPVPEGTVTGQVSGATRDRRHSTGVRGAQKRKTVKQGTFNSLT